MIPEQMSKDELVEFIINNSVRCVRNVLDFEVGE
jgi:hypothetical protein